MKNIIGALPQNIQGFFEYDSKKSGSLTKSHLRISENAINKPYLIKAADFIVINHPSYLEKYDILRDVKENGFILLNSSNKPKINELNLKLLTEKSIKVYQIDAFKIARENGLNNKICTAMLYALLKVGKFLVDSDVKNIVISELEKTFTKKALLDLNIKMLENIDEKINLISSENFSLTEKSEDSKKLNDNSSEAKFYEDIAHPISINCGDKLPVSLFNSNGSMPTGTSKFEKRNISSCIPDWSSEHCIRCGKCAFVCPHSVIKFNIDNNIDISELDCTGCANCVAACPIKGKALKMKEKDNASKEIPPSNKERKTAPFFDLMKKENYFEFSGACSGCGEAAYVKLLSQLFGDNLVIANATGCSSIYSASYPISPFTRDENGKGVSWASSLFEDNAEFGLGIKIGKELNGDKENVWIVGGDGWAYDIGYGGLDHILSLPYKVRILVLDSETYSNTGGQQSKATSYGATAKLASDKKKTMKKPLSSMLLHYENLFVASVSIGMRNSKAVVDIFEAANNHDGPSIVFAYSSCISHKFNMSESFSHMASAVECGYFPAFIRSSSESKILVNPDFEKLNDFLDSEGRFSLMTDSEKEDLKNSLASRHNTLKKLLED